ncbi:hypothetical protein ACH492_22450 [Streptomyces sp. NPDC019443]|uniref:hypothetical protein n=1 Tax=Streptomyces sp. NPDC019443 TaxID=3365061 RepID=UPI0037A3A747
MSARDELTDFITYLLHKAGVLDSLMDDEQAGPVHRKVDQLLAAAQTETRGEAFNEAAEVAVRAARACGNSETGQYAASVAAGIGKELRHLAASSPRTAAAEQPESAVEFGVLSPEGHVLCPTPVREDAERHLTRFRAMYPTARLVQRTSGPWVEVSR